jgi:hypothetical protein
MSALARTSLLLCLFATSAGHAQAPHAECSGGRVLVLKPSNALDAALMDEVRTDLATELEQDGVSVCHPNSTRDPSVVVELARSDDALIIELDDRVTHKRVARDISLARIPANGRALAVAIAIDELLRASWAELTLRERPAPPSAPVQPDATQPTTVETRAVNARGAEPVTHRADEPRNDVGVVVGMLHTPLDYTAFTLSGRFATRLWQRGLFEARVSATESLAASSDRGDVIARGGGGSLALGLCGPRPHARLYACGLGRASLDGLVFRGVRPEAASARKHAAAVVHAGGVAQLGVSLTRKLFMWAELSLSAVLVGARATDGARTLMGIDGWLLGAQLGLGMRL